MSKTVLLTDLEYKVIHHALNNLPLDWETFKKSNYKTSMDLLVDSFPNDSQLTESIIDSVIDTLLSDKFEL